MKALSLRSPWPWAVLSASKNIENRDWSSNFRGRVLIHVSKWYNRAEIEDDLYTIWRVAGLKGNFPEQMPQYLKWMGGHIVGSVEIVDCVSESDSPWFFGKYGFVLRNPISFTNPFLFKGALGFFDVPDELARNAGEPLGAQ